jgi:protein phosphatase 2C
MGGYEHLALVGTTAVVALIGNRMLYVANCGDSRAVLCRSGGALPLTDDHKAAREDETVRAGAARDAAGWLILSRCVLWC